jgi:hypothetical protein
MLRQQIRVSQISSSLESVESKIFIFLLHFLIVFQDKVFDEGGARGEGGLTPSRAVRNETGAEKRI